MTSRNGCATDVPSRARDLMADKINIPVGVRLSTDIEYRPDRPTPYRARVRWTDPTSKRRQSLSEGKDSEEEAQEWLQTIIEAAQAGLSPSLATMKLAEYGEANMALALRGLELKTLDPYLAGWRMRVVPALGHLAVRMITNGVVDRTVQNWIADEHSRSTVKNTIAVLVRVMEQAVRDGIIKVNPARVTGWQKLYKQAEDELLDPRALALPDWETLVVLANALVTASHDQYRGWGDVVVFAACTAARIGEVSGCRVGDIDTTQWIWTVRRQTTPAPGGLTDKGTKGKRARKVPIVEEIRPLVAQRVLSAGPNPDAPPVHRPARRTHLHRRPTRRHTLGRRGHQPRLRAPTPPRPPAHRTDLVRRRRSPGTRPATHRRPRLPDHHPALPAPGRTQDHGRRGGALRTPQRAPRTTLAAEPDRRDPLTWVKGAGPQLVPRNDQGPVSDTSETGPDLRLSPVGTTGFEPATP
ncbi:site-specific integrase [Streptomyces caeruleatus]|uniref:site-specific integrase n=1 Tax=Streptomyces caeruleatus TaxID=661399 RepID=UPI003CC6C591